MQFRRVYPAGVAPAVTARHIAVFLLAALPLTAQYSTEKEAALGKQLADDALRKTPPLDSPAVQNYVRTLGHRLAAHIPNARFVYSFHVIADDCGIHEPVALPAGYILVPAGMFNAARDEAEFAGMLAHAMNLAQRPGVRQGRPMAGAGTPVIFVAQPTTNCLVPPAMPMSFLKWQRAAELEADALAVQTMARAGFDPDALVRYIASVQGSLPETPQVFSAIPDRETRVAAMRSAIEKLPPIEASIESSSEFANAKEEVRRLTAPRARPPAPPSLFRK